jgi:hypothetical protein
VVDLTQLELLPGDEPRIAAELIDRVRRQRGDFASPEVTLRAGDLEALALASNLATGELVRRLQPALRLGGAEPNPGDVLRP